MLTKDDTACAKSAGKQKQSTEWPYWIVEEKYAERIERTDQAAHANHVSADLPPSIDGDAYNLGYEGSHDDATEEHCYVHLSHNNQASSITDEGNNVRHVTMFAMAQLPMRPPFENTEEVDAHMRNEDGEDIDQHKYEQLVRPWQHAQIAEEEQPKDYPQRAIQWGEKRRKHFCYLYQFLFAHIIFTFFFLKWKVCLTRFYTSKRCVEQ